MYLYVICIFILNSKLEDLEHMRSYKTYENMTLGLVYVHSNNIRMQGKQNSLC
jgi:hypothetical protein